MIISTPKHIVSIVVDGTEIKGWESYQISTSMTDPVDTFTIRRPFRRDVWDLCREDREVQVLIDGVPMITGFIDDRDAPEDSYVIEVAGRCKIGRLADDCSETLGFSGLGIKELITKLAAPFFSKVTFSNTRDRAIRRGKGKKARAGNEPVTINTRKGSTQIEPGQTRWQVISNLLEQTGLLAWSSGDGKELIVSKPNYEQEIQFRFFRPSPGSRRANESTVLGMGAKRSTGDRYSRVLVVGSGAGTSVNFGASVASRSGEAKNNPATVDGDGLDFTKPKRLVVQRSLGSSDEADELADREMAKRDAQGDILTVRAPAHGQRIARTFTTLFANDLLASCEHEPTGTTGTYAITSCAYQQSRQGGAETVMKLVRKGAELG